MRRAVWFIDWYGRTRDVRDLGRLVPVPGVGGLSGGLLDGWSGAIIGSLVGVGGLVIVLLGARILDRVWPLPQFKAESSPMRINQEAPFGAALISNGRRVRAWVSTQLTANNPGAHPERITRLYCELSKRWLWFIPRRVVRVKFDSSIYEVSPELTGRPDDCLLDAASAPETRAALFSSQWDADAAQGARVGGQVQVGIITEFVSPRRIVAASLPEIHADS